MKKTSIYLDEALDDALALRAAEEGITKAELIRATLAGEIGRSERPPKPAIGVYSGPGNVARDVDAALAGFGS